MPPTSRQRAPDPQMPETLSSDEHISDNGEVDGAEELLDGDEDEGTHDIMQQIDGDEDDDAHMDLAANMPANPPPPRHSREISSLASWTVSSSKPGCGISALRDPSPNIFWQSDGPQPHFLNIHFFKIVSIVGIRLYLDFSADESYTPTKIQFLAGMGRNDLVAFSILELEQPRGWIEIDMSGVGSEESEVDSDYEDSQDETQDEQQKSGKRKVPVLRAMLVQVKILENHQNGKDTHLRGLQIYARDGNTNVARGERKAPQSDNIRIKNLVASRSGNPQALAIRSQQKKRLMQPDWGAVPDLR